MYMCYENARVYSRELFIVTHEDIQLSKNTFCTCTVNTENEARRLKPGQWF